MHGDFSLSGVLEKLYDSQLVLETAVMELTLRVEQQGSRELGKNARGAQQAIGKNSSHTKQALARLKRPDIG